uniref:sensor histidine kinase n=1 Tax=Lutibacter citreus TaxID=2138210 RepID=UPI001FECDCC9|nr:HAMP domain-containing sensor histidine kinase [Lutibacter citreus]
MSKIFLVTGLVLAILSVVLLYFYTKNLLQDEVEEELFSTEARIVSALENGEIEYSLQPVTEVKRVSVLKSLILKDTIIYDPSQDEMELFRELSTFKNINKINYKITVRTLVVESENILIAVVVAYLVVFSLAFLFLYYLNTSRNLKLWNPFFQNLEQMKSFSLLSNKPLNLVESDILEFSELKNEIVTLTEKVKADYETLKQFTENVSHEIQTPLAVIQAKIDNIINGSSISEVQFKQITSIQKDIQRLKSLNKRITLLSKIDNNQFVKLEQINLNSFISNSVENFKELHNSNISFDFNNDLIVSMDSYLVEILCNNLISNAIKYSTNKDCILIKIKNQTLTISNFGEEPLHNPEKLFLRFYKETNNKQSTGLGLAIVKKICDLYGYKLTYYYKEHKHFFSVKFK